VIKLHTGSRAILPNMMKSISTVFWEVMSHSVAGIVEIWHEGRDWSDSEPEADRETSWNSQISSCRISAVVSTHYVP